MAIAIAAPCRAEPWRLVSSDPDQGPSCFVERPDATDAAVAADGAAFALLYRWHDVGGEELRIIPVYGGRERRIPLVGRHDCTDDQRPRFRARLPAALREANALLERGGYVSLPSMPRLGAARPSPLKPPERANAVGDADVSVAIDSETGHLRVTYRGRLLLSRHIPSVRVAHAEPFCRVRVPERVEAWRAARWLLMMVYYSGGHGCEPNTSPQVLPPFMLPKELPPPGPATLAVHRPARLDSRLRLAVRTGLGGRVLGELPTATGAGMDFPAGNSWALAPLSCRDLDTAFMQALAGEVRRLHAPAVDLSACGQDGSSGLAALNGTGIKELALRPYPGRPDRPRRSRDVNLSSLRSMRGLQTLEVVGSFSPWALIDLDTLPDLRRLRLRGATLTTDGLLPVGRFPRVAALELRDCVIAVARALPWFPVPQEVAELDLSGTRMPSEMFAGIRQHHQLRALTLRGLGLTAKDLVHVGHLPWLRRLVLDEAVDDAAVGSLCGLHLLVSLTLRSDRIGDAGARQLRCLTQLRELRLGATSSHIGDEGLGHLSTLRDLEVLDLAGSRISDAGLPRLKSLHALRELHLDRTAISAKGLSAIARLPQLEVLSLNGSRVAGGLQQLAGLTRLRSLSLDATEIDDDALAALASLPALYEVSACSTRVTEAGRARLRSLAPRIRVAECPRTAAP